MAETIGTAYVQIEPSFEGTVSQIDKEFGGVGKEAGKTFSNGFASVMGSTGKVMAGAVAAGGAALTAIGTQFISASADVASYGDNIDKMSQKMGLTAQAYQEWDAVMQHSGTSMETMKASMKTLANAAETGNEAFAELGITQEQIATMSQQDLFEATIAGLQKVEDDTTRTYLAGKLLGKGATELGALLNTSAEDTQAMRDRVRELGGVMSDDAVKAAAAYQDQLQDMQTAFSGLSRNLISEFLPGITTVMAGLTEIFSGNSDAGIAQLSEGISSIATNILTALPQIASAATQIITAIGQAIVQNLPTLLSTGISILQELATGIIQAIPTMLPTLVDFIVQIGNMIIENLPMLVEAAAQVVVSLALGIAEALPTLIPTIIDVILTISQYLIENIDLLLDASAQLMIGLAVGLINALPVLIEKVPQIIVALVQAFIKFYAKLYEVGKMMLTKIKDAFVNAWPQMVSATINLFTQLKEKLISLASLFLNVGKNIVESIKKGISEAWDSLVSWFKGLLDGLVDAVKEFFKIGFPSDLMADEVGYWIPAGIAQGVKKGMALLNGAMDDLTADVFLGMSPKTLSGYIAPGADNLGANNDNLYSLLSAYLPVIAKGLNVNVVLEGDAGRMFKAMQNESIRNTQIAGVHSVLSAR